MRMGPTSDLKIEVALKDGIEVIQEGLIKSVLSSKIKYPDYIRSIIEEVETEEDQEILKCEYFREQTLYNSV